MQEYSIFFQVGRRERIILHRDTYASGSHLAVDDVRCKSVVVEKNNKVLHG
jgi:hypothetical protein